MAAFGVLASCLRRRMMVSLAVLLIQKVRSTFKKVHQVAQGKLACL